ncbi:MAG TPA: CHRD domain-containing protein [Herbaspirillum sp.]|jgi:hypothetical protein
MKVLQKNMRLCLSVALASAALIIAGCSGMGMKDGARTQTLTGAQEVPPVASNATAISTVKIGADRMVSGTITTTGIVPTMAHIHMAPTPGANGPVIVPFKKTADNVFSAPDNTMLTDEQYAALQAGRLYVNVHSAAHPAGEVRANLPPN